MFFAGGATQVNISSALTIEQPLRLAMGQRRLSL